MEVWKDVNGYEGAYQVSDQGRVRSLDRTFTYLRNGMEVTRKKRGKVLSPSANHNGYLSVMLSGSRQYVHRLVAQAFLPNDDKLPEVNHLNAVRGDNRLCNLEWCSRMDNVKYKEQCGTVYQGDQHHYAKLNEESVRMIRSQLDSGMTEKFVAGMYGVSQSTINYIKLRKTWKHLA
ncbi:NUMOD4 domain-containing protein [Paenibacillus sp. NPDC093718]|uniref:NUMOD4 domain-containing protein n=1 Tax=Paenibacillus sp. NPDC093718 TaxID=3390601 RepID=UPI003CFFEBFA